MLKAAAVTPRALEPLWRLMRFLHLQRAEAPTSEPCSMSVENLPSARLRDLGYEADQVGETSISLKDSTSDFSEKDQTLSA